LGTNIGERQKKIVALHLFGYFKNSCFLLPLLVSQGEQFIDISKPILGKDRRGKLLGVDVYESYDCKFGILRNLPNSPTEARLTLTVDLRAKILRTESVRDVLYNAQLGRAFSKQDQNQAIRSWTGQQVIYKQERKGTVYRVGNCHHEQSSFDASLTQLCPVDILLKQGTPSPRLTLTIVPTPR
jgi:hypothetical protein